MIDKLIESLVQGGPWAAFAAALVFYLGAKIDRLSSVIAKREESDTKSHAALEGKLSILLDRRLP